MTLKPENINQRLKELDQILQELDKHRHIDRESLRANLGQRWIIERGLIAATSIILDMADYILASHFGAYVETYEESLEALQDHAVISIELYQKIKGLGGFRNILVHGYLGIDTDRVFDNFRKVSTEFPVFAQEILAWLDAQIGG